MYPTMVAVGWAPAVQTSTDPVVEAPLTTGAVTAGVPLMSTGHGPHVWSHAYVPIPAAITVFPGENYQAPRSWAEKAYPKLIYFNEVDKGGHFAAWEQPALFSAEVRAAFRSLRS